MATTFISEPPFPLNDGETLWRLDSGELVTVAMLAAPTDGRSISFHVTGRRLNDDGSVFMEQTPFDRVPRPVTLPAKSHTIMEGVLSDSTSEITLSGKLAEWQLEAINAWPGYLISRAALKYFPVATRVV